MSATLNATVNATDALLGIDLGTSSVKVLVTTTAGQVLAAASAEYPILHPAPGQAEQDPEDWWQATVQAVRAALAQAPGTRVAAIGFSGQMHGAVLLDRHGAPVGNAIIWPDQRSAQQVQEITALAGPERLYRIAGSPVSTGFQAASIRWVQQEQPDRWERVAMILLPKDYLRWRLTGVYATDPSDGAGALLLDETTRTWSGELLALLAVDPACLPPVQPAAQVAGGLVAGAAQALGLDAGTPVVTGAADTACGMLGAGAIVPGQLILSISTGGQLIQPVDRVAVDPKGRIHTFCSALEPAPGRPGWYQMGATLAAGLALRWLRDNVFALRQADAYATMTALAAAVPAGARGLTFLPYLVGERTPHMDPTARGAFFGLTVQHGQGDLVRAVMEGVTFALYDGYQVLVELGASADRITLAGGGARSELWRQIVADIFGLPVQPLLTGDQSALGAVLLAGAGVGLFDLVDAAQAWAKLGPVTAPAAKRHAAYAEDFGAFQALYQRNRGSFIRDLHSISQSGA